MKERNRYVQGPVLASKALTLMNSFGKYHLKCLKLETIFEKVPENLSNTKRYNDNIEIWQQNYSVPNFETIFFSSSKPKKIKITKFKMISLIFFFCLGSLKYSSKCISSPRRTWHFYFNATQATKKKKTQNFQKNNNNNKNAKSLSNILQINWNVALLDSLRHFAYPPTMCSAMDAEQKRKKKKTLEETSNKKHLDVSGIQWQTIFFSFVSCQCQPAIY